MSPHPEQVSRSWFNKSKSSHSKDPRLQLTTDKLSSSREAGSSKSTGNTLNQLASAIGLKSKKQSNLAIQSPSFPSSHGSPLLSPSPMYKAKSKSYSTSSFHSPMDDFDQPRHPMGRRDTMQSRFTMSDDDPFAAHSKPSPIPPLPHDDNRLSAYSNSSMSERDKFPSRGSIASSSSHSNYFSHEHGPHSPTSSRTSNTDASVHKLASKRSIGSLTRAGSSTSSKWNEPNPMSSKYPDHSTQWPRPPIRARGMTESSYRSISSDLPYSTFPPRHTSVNHAVSPPTSPPPNQLPRLPGNIEAAYISGGRGASSSKHTRNQKSIDDHARFRQPVAEATFVSQLEGRADCDDDFYPVTPQTIQPLKSLRSMSSQQSLTSSSTTHQDHHHSGPKKQRSFHRLHLHGSSSRAPAFFPPPDELSALPNVKRGGSSAGPVSPRKRVFSGSSIRPSTSTGAEAKDNDTLSITSLQSTSYRPHHNSLAAAGSRVMETWPSPSKAPPTQETEFVPQQILSAQQLAELEEIYAAETEYVRSRTTSIASASEYQSEISHDVPSLLQHGSKISLLGGTSLSTRTSASRLERVPDSLSSTSSVNGLTPPARFRTLTSAPPTPDAITGLVALSPAPRKPMHRKVSAERAPKPEKARSTKSTRRRSIIRKPSFLDIGNDDEETDRDEGPSSSAARKPQPMESSFLDLDRESFDTLRSN